MGQLIYANVAYGTAAVGYDLLAGKRENKEARARKITSVACVGGGAAGDCGVEIFVGGRSCGVFMNSSTGNAPKTDTDHKTINQYVPANAQIEAKVIDAAPSGTVCIELAVEEAASTGYRRSGYRRSYSGRRSTGRRSYGGGSSSGMY